MSPAARRRGRAFVVVGSLLGATLVVFMALPTLALFITAGPRDIVAGFRHPVALPALALSLATTSVSLAIVVILGTPLAWWLRAARGRTARLIESLVSLPVVIPPAVAGIALLLAFGRRGLLGGVLERLGLSVSFSTTAVVLAQVFVSAPFFVQGAATAFRSIDLRVRDRFSNKLHVHRH